MNITTHTMKKHLPKTGSQSMAWMLLFVFSFQLVFPSTALAGGGGPTQPEVHGFTPIDATNMVDPFTGDFSYNIPLMDVDGYPINIAYSSGITMDQEASWVGLGWNLNVGSVVRTMRGLPDDFNGETVQHTTYMKPNRTISIHGGLGAELFGKKLKSKFFDSLSIKGSASLAIAHNNYNGYSTQISLGPSFSFLKTNSHSLTAGFQLSGSSENGASFSPSLSFQSKIKETDRFDRSLSGSVGSSLNSRSGLSELSYTGKLKMVNSTTTNKHGKSSLGFSSSHNVGLSYYSPTSGPSMHSLSVSGSLKVGSTAIGVDGSYDVGISYSSQWIPDDQITIETPSYGYFYMENGQKTEKAQLDFNRDNDGSFTKYTPSLPSAFLTCDIYSIQAQGISGSYRGFRNEVGYVFDPKVTTTSESGSFGLEVGLGDALDNGVDITLTSTSAHTGGWNGFLNKAEKGLRFEPAATGLESFAMQEASESSVDTDPLATAMGGSAPNYFPLTGALNFVSAQNTLKSGSTVTEISGNNRSARIKRNQLLSFMSYGELQNGFGLDTPVTLPGAKSHHIGQITQLGTDGRRYVFGIAAYNHFQEETTFATGKTIAGSPGISVSDHYNGLINYTGQNATQLLSPDNTFGIDNYYSSSTTPAYAHSYLLTAVLSDDYTDSDTLKGPSPDDMGTYVKFNYEKVEDYKWRTPIQANSAFRNEGMKTDLTDDKASFIYGEKDLWYVKAIETKNNVAVFVLEDRNDGAAAAGRNGGLNGGKRMKLLREIRLYSKPDYDANINNLNNATPLQVVHFDYDYSLCQGYPGNTDATTGQTGKLKLQEISFTYQKSGKMKRSSYTFEYGNGDLNPGYNMKAVDRWGNYKPTAAGLGDSLHKPMNNADFPYTDQNPANTDNYVAAWCLKAINLPSGGRIEVDYESDDYAYVQHLDAMQMFQIVGTSTSIAAGGSINSCTPVSVSSDGNKNERIYFKLKPGYDDINDYVKVGQFLYFRCLVDFRTGDPGDSPTKYEYVSGYGMVGTVGTTNHSDGTKLGYIDFVGERLKDDEGSDYNPISKFAIQFGRMHLSRFINDPGVGDPADGSEQGLADFARSVAGSVTSFGELFEGPNKVIWHKGCGRNIVTNKSWIRVQEPSHRKLGGGHRVKAIRNYDNWNVMTNGATPGFSYGQRFVYRLPDGTSSGVASYEPQVGGDENPWHQPIPFANKIRWGTDNKLYQEDPLMESQFPSPSVGYSRVEIIDIKPDNVTRTANGKVVKEFYTAKDFPTIVKASDIDLKTAHSFLPFIPSYQYLTASQGFTIELNDMHGKPKKESVYAEGVGDSPISTVEYRYQQEQLNQDGVPNYHLVNTVNTINARGEQAQAEIGVRFEAVADFRESTTRTFSGSQEFNVNSFLLGVIPVIVPTFWPTVSSSSNEFHSATMNKVVNRFGVLEKVVANQDGSIVETNNLAYDAETGEVLVTQTTTDFNDKVFSMKYPAYWGYDEMGQAYKNTGVTFSTVNFNGSGSAPIPEASNYFVPGDEVAVTASGFKKQGWIVSSVPTGITVIDKAGNPLSVSNATVKVIRSGRKNKQSVSMANITSLSNPLSSITSNNYSQVLNAGAVEFGQNWKSYCDCFTGPDGSPTTVNPYVMGTLGNWRPVKSYTHLSGRTQSDYDNNTNIRKDGVMTSYSPYYKLQNSSWTTDPTNWTFVSEVTAFSPNGMTFETRDALGRYSASLFGFHNTLTTAISANTRFTQMAALNFEDVDFTNCSDQQISLVVPNGSPATIKKTDAHTGNNSLRVQAGSPVEFVTSPPTCKESACDLGIFGSDNFYFPSGGTVPYTVTTEVVSGAVDAVVDEFFGSYTIQIIGETSQYCEVIMTVTDAKGCVVTYDLVQPGN